MNTETQTEWTAAQKNWCPGKSADEKAEAMRETIRQFGSVVRQSVTDKFEGYLLNAVHETHPCGCRITGNGSLPLPLSIQFCPTHTIAHELAGALRDMLNSQVECRVLLCKLQDFLAPSRSKSADSAIERLDEAEETARALIAKLPK